MRLNRIASFISALILILSGCGNDYLDIAESIDGDIDSQADGDSETEIDQGHAPYNWPTCDRIVLTNTSLAEMAAEFDQVSKDWHISPDGLFRNVYLTEDLGSVETWHHTPNTGLWSGIYLASQAFRYAVTGDQKAQENAKRIVVGMRDLSQVTGIKGLYGRSMIKPGVPYPSVPDDAPGWATSTAPGYEGWRFSYDQSQDGTDGVMFGYALALQHFDDPELLADVSELAFEIADHLVSNGLQIIDITGEVTEHGRLYHSALDNFPGFNAMLASSWIRVAIAATGDSELDDFYYGCLMGMRDGIDCPDIEDEGGIGLFGLTTYIDSMEKHLHLFIPGCKHNIDNFDMCYQAIYPLLQVETNAGLRERLRNVVRTNMFDSPDPNHPDIPALGNAFFTFAYAALTDDDPEADTVLASAVDEAICTLKQFPPVKFRRHIPKGVQESVCLNRLDKPTSATKIPLAEYDFDNYLWRLDFFEIVPNEIQEDRRQVWSPEDFLMAYWMARYHGIIPADL